MTLTVNGTNYVGTVLAGNILDQRAGLGPAGVRAGEREHHLDRCGGQRRYGGGHAGYTVDLASAPTITLGTVTADNVVNAAEAGGTVAVSGTVGGEANVGDTVTLTVNGANYTVLCRPGNTFSINVLGSDLQATTVVNASITSTDAAGNVGTVGDTQVYTVDIGVPAPTITLNAVTTDNVLNAAEAGGTVALTGTVGGDASVGDTVTLTVNGANYTGLVQVGNVFSINVLGSDLQASTVVNASVSSTDVAGNVGAGVDTQVYTVDLASAPTITLGTITADNVVNAAEAGGSVAITGSVGGEANVGDTVTLTVNGATYTGTVAAGNTFSIAVLGSDLQATTVVQCEHHLDRCGGQRRTVGDPQVYTVDVILPTPTVTLNAITADNIVNAAEAGGTVAVTGTWVGMRCRATR